MGGGGGGGGGRPPQRYGMNVTVSEMSQIYVGRVTFSEIEIKVTAVKSRSRHPDRRSDSKQGAIPCIFSGVWARHSGGARVISARGQDNVLAPLASVLQ